MVQVVADCLERDGKQKFHHLFFSVSDSDEVLKAGLACAAALAN